MHLRFLFSGKSCKYYEGEVPEVKCEVPQADEDSGSDAEVSNIDFSSKSTSCFL